MRIDKIYEDSGKKREAIWELDKKTDDSDIVGGLGLLGASGVGIYLYKKRKGL